VAPDVAAELERMGITACFSRKSQKRTTQITATLDTLKALGHID
jgi:hypothetical protein